MDTTQFATAQKAAVDSLLDIAGQAFEGVEKLAALNLQVVKTTLAEGAEFAPALLSAKTPDEFLKLYTATVQAAPQKALAYGRQVAEIVTAASAVQRAAAEAQVSEAQTKFVEALNATLKNAPGSENAIALVQSAVDAANKAREGLSTATQQVSDALTANVATLTETAVKATPRATRAKAEA